MLVSTHWLVWHSWLKSDSRLSWIPWPRWWILWHHDVRKHIFVKRSWKCFIAPFCMLDICWYEIVRWRLYSYHYHFWLVGALPWILLLEHDTPPHPLVWWGGHINYPHLSCLRSSLFITPLITRTTLCIVRSLLSVHLPVLCLNSKPILKLFRPSDSSIILVFWPLVPIPNSKGTPSAGHKIHGVGKICNFWLESPSVSETMRDRHMVTMER